MAHRAALPQDPVRFAIVGQSCHSHATLLAAFVDLATVEVVHHLSDDPEWFDAVLAADECDAVYLALPAQQARLFTERAAARNKHVICEKQQAFDDADCRAMFEACAEMGVKLMFGRALHREAGSREVVGRIRRAVGEARLLQVAFTVKAREEPCATSLDDLGVHCVDVARRVFRSDPVAVEAFLDVPSGDASVVATLHFADGRVAEIAGCYGDADRCHFICRGERGTIDLDQSFTVGADLPSDLARFVRSIVLDGDPARRDPTADTRVLAAVHRSAASGSPVVLGLA